MKRLVKWGLIVGVLLGVGAAAYPSLGRYLQERNRIDFREAAVERGRIVEVINSTGTIQPVLSVQIGAAVSGPVIQSDVDFNSRVHVGQVLAKIDPRLYQANVARDEANLAHATAEVKRIAALLEQATNDERRALALRSTKDSYISDAELDQFKAQRGALAAQLEVGGAAVKQAEANLGLSKTNLEYTVIKSPVDGVVIDRKIDPGQTVAAQFQTPVLFIVAPEMETRMNIYASVDEADIGQVRDAQRRRQPVRFTVDAYPDDLFEGAIDQVRMNSTTTQNVVTYTVVVQSPNPDLKLMPGMTTSLSFQIAKKDDVLRIPNAALRYFPRLEHVRPEDRLLLEGLDPRADEDAEPASTEERRSADEKAAAARNRNRRHVWVRDGDLLRAVEVQVGLSDSEFTELVSGQIEEGQNLATGIRPPQLAGVE